MLAGDVTESALGVCGGVIVEVGELLLEATQALVVGGAARNLFTRERAQEARVVVRGNRPANATGRTASLTDDKPENTAQHGQENDSRNPDLLGEGANSTAVGQQCVDDAVHPEGDRDDGEDDQDTRHAESVRRTRSALTERALID